MVSRLMRSSDGREKAGLGRPLVAPASASLKAEQKSLESQRPREAGGAGRARRCQATPRRKARSVRRNGRPAHHRASGGPLRMRAGMNGTGCLHQPRVGRPLRMVVPGMRRATSAALSGTSRTSHVPGTRTAAGSRCKASALLIACQAVMTLPRELRSCAVVQLRSCAVAQAPAPEFDGSHVD